MSELSFLERVRNQLAKNADVLLGVGDDCAEVAVQKGSLLLAADMLMEGVHFNLAETSFELVGRKALAVNLSDVAAMGGEAIAALCSLALPRNFSDEQSLALMRGMASLAAEFNVAIVGGDTNSWRGPLVVNVSIIGRPHAKGAVKRGGGKVGDWILVTGSLGGSLSGKHLSFTPRLKEAKVLMDRWHLHAMIDLSDGLATDLRHITKESGLGAKLDLSAVPITPGLCKDGIKHALCDGEDFELCFCVDPQDGHKIIAAQPFQKLTITKVGELIEGSDLWHENQGKLEKMIWRGFEH